MKRRNTPTKEAVLEVLKTAGKAMSQDAIEQEIRMDINRATIYRVLNRFCEDGVLHRIVADDGKQYFALSDKNDNNKVSDNHFHFKCLACDTIECLPNEVSFTVPNAYSVAHMNCVLTGICKDCS